MATTGTEAGSRANVGKLDAFEGIRGIASLAVFIGHLVIAFWPVLYNPGHPYMILYPNWVVSLAEGPTRVLIDGQFAVVLFFLLSGFVLSLGYFRHPTGDAIASGAARRYLRLMLPASVSIILAYYVMKRGWMYNQWASVHMTQLLSMPHVWLSYFYNFNPNSLSAIREAVWDTFFTGGCNYNKNLWTMSVELAGSFLVYAFVSMFGSLRYRIVYYLAVGAVLALTVRYHMLQFLLGVAVADLYAGWERGNRRFRIPAPIGIALAALAIYLVSCKPMDHYTILGTQVAKSTCYESACALLLITTTAFCPALQWAFSCRPFVFLGKISFTLYLLHLIAICSLACYVYLKLQGKFGISHNVAGLWASAACMTATVIAAWVMYLAVDRPSIRLTSALYKRIFKVARPQPPVIRIDESRPAIRRAA